MLKKIDKTNEKGQLYFRYLFSYLVLVLIPMIIIGSFYTTSFFRTFKNEVFINVDKDLINVVSRMDSEQAIFINTVQQVSISPQLKGIGDQFSPEKINQLKYLLSSYNATNLMSQEIYAVLPDLGYVITTTSSISIPYFTNRLFSMDGVSSIELERFLNSEIPAFMPFSTLRHFGYEPCEAMLFSYPLHNDSLRQIGNLIFQVPYQLVESLFNDKLSMYEAQTFIYNHDLALIAGIGDNPDTRKQLSRIKTDGLEDTIKALKKDYIVRSYRSPDNRLTYITLIPLKQNSFTQITRLNYLFLLALLIAVLFSFAAIVYALRLNYSPLKRLQDKAGKLVNGSRSSNEISDIEEALEMLSGRNLSLTAQLEDNAGSIKSMRIRKLLTNGYDSIEGFNMDCLELDMHLTGKRIFITTSYIHTPSTDLAAIGQIMKQFLSDSWTSYYLCPLEVNKLILVHNISDDFDLDSNTVFDLFSALHSRISKIHDVLITTGIGSIVTGTGEISRSYLESSAALDYRYVKGNGQIIEFGEINTDPQNRMVYPKQNFEKLVNAIHAENESSVNQCIDEIIEIIDENNYPLSVARGICFNLINIATNTTMPPNLFALSEVETIQDLITILKNWRTELYHPTLSDALTPSVTVKEVTDYLKLHCLKANFSIYETAEHFAMSLPKFSQYFKEKTNQNILDYSIQIRMNEAARLLSDTSMDIKDIAMEVGYYSTSSFIRRFKQIQGVTPGDYRKHVSKTKGDIKS